MTLPIPTTGPRSLPAGRSHSSRSPRGDLWDSPVASVSRACARDHRPSPATGGTAAGPRPGYRQPAFAATDPDPSSRSTSQARTGSTPCGRAAVPPRVFDIPIAGSLLSTGMSEIAQAIADRQSEIDRLQAEIKALTDVEQILGASAPAARSTSSSPTKAAAAADKSEAKPARKRREMSAAEKKAVSERMTAYWAERRKKAAKK